MDSKDPSWQEVQEQIAAALSILQRTFNAVVDALTTQVKALQEVEQKHPNLLQLLDQENTTPHQLVSAVQKDESHRQRENSKRPRDRGKGLDLAITRILERDGWGTSEEAVWKVLRANGYSVSCDVCKLTAYGFKIDDQSVKIVWLEQRADGRFIQHSAKYTGLRTRVSNARKNPHKHGSLSLK